jgi:hypothetical protein
LWLVPPRIARGVLKSYSAQLRLQDRIAFSVQPYRHDSPVPTSDEIDVARLSQPRALPNFPRDYHVFDDLLSRLEPYVVEFNGRPVQRTPHADFWFRNGAYEEFDALTLYSMLRYLKPRRMVEVGCGNSSRVTTIALRKNSTEGRPCDCTFVEPYPPAHLQGFSLYGPMLKTTIQKAPLEIFTALDAGDVLFIDTSHVIKTQNDLCDIFHRVLPALRPGVHIHFHDIFSPYDYPERWLLEISFHFNEQYVLEALLCNSHTYDIELPVYALWKEAHPGLRRFWSGETGSPGAFWIVKR